MLELRSGLAYIRLLVADLRLHLELKAGFNSDQPRDDHGRWTDTGGGSGGGGVRVAQANDVERYRVARDNQSETPATIRMRRFAVVG